MLSGTQKDKTVTPVLYHDYVTTMTSAISVSGTSYARPVVVRVSHLLVNMVLLA